jgi:hypothetical protein
LIGALEWLPMKDAPNLAIYARFLQDVQGIFCWDGCWTNVLAFSTGFGFDGPFHLL